MGNEKSILKGIEVDERSVEVTDFWTQYGANIDDSNRRRVSVFISEPSLHYAASFGRPSPLEKAAKNLMLHRHPCILKYISSWSKSGKFFLTTEEAKPLIQVIEAQSTLQICIGLHSILRALVFLHEKALALHNNVCSNAIYVTSEGCWKLAGLEFLCRFSELSPTYFQKIKTYRYERSISPDEDIMTLISSANTTAIDAYAFGILAEDILKLRNTDDVPALTEFREFCKENLQNPDPSIRNKLSTVLQHPFFNHDFIRIYAFLEELPLKSDNEKQEFFSGLIDQLKTYPENIVGEQLSRLLLSRMVLLDATAKTKLLPFVLRPRDENTDSDESTLFAVPTFKKYLIPRLLQIFRIRDASIRLLLLCHFKSFIHVFQTEELKSHILPELLVGIKDTNDYLVSATLKALADMIPILGAATVIGGNRGKLFTDGRPNKVKDQVTTNTRNLSSESTKQLTVPISIMANVVLPERPSPDGGEDQRDSKFAFTEEECTWSDWDAQDTSNENHLAASQIVQNSSRLDNTAIVESASDTAATDNNAHKCARNLNTEASHLKKSVISDISELDIKHSKSMKQVKDEIDFFTDMEPVIKKTQVLHVQEPNTVTLRSKFDVHANDTMDECEENNGWSEALSDWGINDVQELKL